MVAIKREFLSRNGGKQASSTRDGGGREFFSTRDSQALSFAVAIDFAFPFSPLPMVDQRISRKSPFDDSDPRCLSD